MKNYIITLQVSLLFLCLTASNWMYGQCNAATYSTNEKDSWLSCQKKISPNNNRGNSHWLQYDLGYIYALGATKFWNYNVTNLTGRGFKQVAIDYSLDGTSWTDGGTFQLPQANGDQGYEGVTGLDLSGISARYILITALSNWNGGTCAGLSEVRFEVAASSSACGDYMVTQNIEGNPIESGTHYGDTPITSNGTVQAGTAVRFKSATAITLTAGFTAEEGSQFLAEIENCNALKTSEAKSKRTKINNTLTRKNIDIKVYPNPTVHLLNIDLGETEITDLIIINVSGHEILRRTVGQNFNQIDVSQLPAGMYLINVLTVNRELIAKRFIKTGL